jgi:hypothetical protein
MVSMVNSILVFISHRLDIGPENPANKPRFPKQRYAPSQRSHPCWRPFARSQDRSHPKTLLMDCKRTSNLHLMAHTVHDAITEQIFETISAETLSRSSKANCKMFHCSSLFPLLFEYALIRFVVLLFSLPLHWLWLAAAATLDPNSVWFHRSSWKDLLSQCLMTYLLYHFHAIAIQPLSWSLLKFIHINSYLHNFRFQSRIDFFYTCNAYRLHL